MTAAVDMSQAVYQKLQSYQAKLSDYRTKVTGDPGALQSAAQKLQGDAQELTTSATTIQNGAETLNTNWTGTAYNGYKGSATQLTQTLQAASSAATSRSTTLNNQAQALTTARQIVDSVIATFTNQGNQLLVEAAQAPPGSGGQLLAMADQIGSTAVSQAQQAANQLGQALVAGGLSSYTQSYDNGTLHQTSAWAKGPSGELDPDNGASLKNGLKLGAKASLFDVGASTTTTDASGSTTDSVSAKADASADVHAKSLTDWGISAQAGVSGNAQQVTSIPGADGSPKASATDFVNGDASGSFHAGMDAKDGLGAGFQQDVGWSAGYKVSGSDDYLGGAIHTDSTLGAAVGAKEGFGLSGGYNNGVLTVDANATAVAGIGASGSIHMTADLPQLGTQISNGASSVYNSVSSSASTLYNNVGSAVNSYGQAMGRAMQENPYIFMGQ